MSTDRFANHDREIIGVITTISIIALTALGLRFMSKLIKRIAVGTDDLLLAFAFVSLSWTDFINSTEKEASYCP